MSYYPYPYPYYPYPQVPYQGSPYPAYPQNNPDQLYQAIDAYGQPVGEPTRFPSIAPQYYYEYYPTYDYNPMATAYVPPPPVPHVAMAPPVLPVAQPQVTHVPVSLPPIQPMVLAPSRMAVSNVNKYPRYAVSDLTERGSVVSLSPRDALRSVQYYDHLRRSYH